MGQTVLSGEVSWLIAEQMAIGQGQQYISGLEHGQRNPTIVSIYELGQTLGVSHEQLVAGADEG